MEGMVGDSLRSPAEVYFLPKLSKFRVGVQMRAWAGDALRPIYTLPNTASLHYISLDSPYASYQSLPV